MAGIRVEADVLNTVGNNFINYGDEIATTEQSIVSSMNILRGTSWESTGKEKIFKLYDESITRILGANAQDVIKLGRNLKRAYKNYEEVAQRLSRLRP